MLLAVKVLRGTRFRKGEGDKSRLNAIVKYCDSGVWIIVVRLINDEEKKDDKKGIYCF